VTLVVGMPASLSGQFRMQGRQALAGLWAWARDANAETPGSFRVVHHDDASDRTTVQDVTRRLIADDQVDILFGPYSSVLTSAVVQVADEHGKLLWNHGGASDNVYQQGYRLIVGILSPASRYLTGLLPLVRQADPDATTVALARASTGEFPKAVCSGVADAAEELGFKTVLTTEFAASTGDFSAVVADIKAAQPEVIVVVGRIQNDLLLARRLAESGVNAGMVVAVAAGIQAFQDDLGRLVERFVGPSQWEPETDFEPDFGPNSQQVMASLRRDGESHVDYPMAQAYAAGVVLQRCLEEAGNADSQTLKDAAARLRFSTFYGNFQIDGETGRQVGRETLLVQWQEGRKVIVWPPRLAKGALAYPWR